MGNFNHTSNKRRINIAFLEPALLVGGAEVALSRLICNLDRTSFNPILCLAYFKGETGEVIEGKGIKTYTCLAKSKYDPGLMYRLYNIFKKENIDILFTGDHPFSHKTHVLQPLSPCNWSCCNRV